MLKIDLSLRVAIPLGQGNFKRLPPVQGGNLPVHIICSKGGEERSFKHEQPIIDEMEVGDEMRQAIQQQNLLVGRFSDSFSLDLQQLYTSGDRVFAFVSAWICSTGNVSKRATLVMNNAQISWFWRETLQGRNFEGIKFTFDSKNARIEYGNNLDVLLMQEAQKIMKDVGSVVGGIMR